MRHKHGVKVAIPFWTTDNMKSMAFLTFDGDVDRRRVLREVRKYVKLTFGITPSKEWLQKVPQYSPRVLVQGELLNVVINEWIERIECHEDEDESDTDCEGGATQTTEAPLQAVPDQSKESSL